MPGAAFSTLLFDGQTTPGGGKGPDCRAEAGFCGVTWSDVWQNVGTLHVTRRVADRTHIGLLADPAICFAPDVFGVLLRGGTGSVFVTVFFTVCHRQR